MARPQDTALARFYGLPKVHKDGAPLRPIVSLKGTPTYGLAKWLFRRLKFLTAESDTTVSSSAQFLEKLKGDLAIETIELLLESKYDETENRLGHAQILQLLKLCLRTYFTFDGTIYEQVKGTPMGSPISGFIAEAVLQRLESLVFQHHRPKFWARYVDDTFVVIERDQVLTFQEHLNAVFPDIQFTMEEEENNQLAFLDVLVCRKDCGGLKTKVFRKATNTMQVLNFNRVLHSIVTICCFAAATAAATAAAKAEPLPAACRGTMSILTKTRETEMATSGLSALIIQPNPSPDLLPLRPAKLSSCIGLSSVFKDIQFARDEATGGILSLLDMSIQKL
nr:unnamed protein product [Spirometra erinaceieuropaei]